MSDPYKGYTFEVTDDETFNKVAKLWASKKFGVPVSEIVKVDFDVYSGSGCDTCGYGSTGIEVDLGNRRVYDLDSMDFQDILNELVSTALEVDE